MAHRQQCDRASAKRATSFAKRPKPIRHERGLEHDRLHQPAAGEYPESLKAYETALKLQPDYAEAIEYLAELYVLTGKLDDAKASFARLVKLSPSYAKVLLQSMRDWLAGPAKTATTVSAPQREAFSGWGVCAEGCAITAASAAATLTARHHAACRSAVSSRPRLQTAAAE